VDSCSSSAGDDKPAGSSEQNQVDSRETVVDSSSTHCSSNSDERRLSVSVTAENSDTAADTVTSENTVENTVENTANSRATENVKSDETSPSAAGPRDDDGTE
jgi:hypothetical protein